MVLEITKELMRFKTMHKNPGEIRRCADFIMKRIEESGNTPELIEQDGVISVRCIPPGAKLLLMSHMDVVDASDKLFEPREENGILWGRGGLDDKYAIAVSLSLMQQFPDKVGMLVTGDEEVGGKNGAKIALQGVADMFAIALDGGDTTHIITKTKGLCKARLSFTGKSGHGSRPWTGVNAIEGLTEDLRRVNEIFADTNEEHWHKTLNVGRIEGGDSFNKIPDHAEAWLDIRYTEQDDPKELMDQIRGRIKGTLTVDTIEPMFEGKAGELAGELAGLAGATLSVAHGASDARYLSENGLQGIIWGADGDGSCHQDDEHVYTESIQKIESILKQFIERRY
ncbi:MAG: M20 family metallopeptidase [Nanobdellota archaeon]